MKRIILILLISLISGCATSPKPMPAPVMIPPTEKCVTIPGEGCKKLSASEKAGGTTAGYAPNAPQE